MQLQSAVTIDDWIAASHVKNYKLHSLYRVFFAGALLTSQIISNGNHSTPIVLSVLSIYFLFSCGAAIWQWQKKTINNRLVVFQNCIDIVFLVLMMHFYHANQSGVGLLLIISVVFASLVSHGRYALFYAAFASICVLLEETYGVLLRNQPQNYINAAMLCFACFATAWLAYTLANRMRSTERLASEQEIELHNLAKINDLIAQEMPNGVLVVNNEQQIQHFNPQFTHLTGLSEQALQTAVKQPTNLETIIPRLATLFDDWVVHHKKEASQTATKFTFNDRDFGARFLSISDNTDDGAVIFVEDWSQIQTQAHQVKLAALGRLTANIAHEIRNPLSSISHATQLLQEDNEDPLTKRMLDIISVNVERLDQIIKDVLELNRRDRTNQETIQLSEFLLEFYQQFCAVEKISSKHFLLDIEDAHINTTFDRRHINQILWNLCKNGWRHSQQQDGSLKLTLTSHSNPNFMMITVTDDGAGIDASIQASLFEPFITTEKNGTGLGLYIAKELAEANGAKLNFQSSPTGTQFTLVIKKG